MAEEKSDSKKNKTSKSPVVSEFDKKEDHPLFRSAIVSATKPWNKNNNNEYLTYEQQENLSKYQSRFC